MSRLFLWLLKVNRLLLTDKEMHQQSIKWHQCPVRASTNGSLQTTRGRSNHTSFTWTCSELKRCSNGGGGHYPTVSRYNRRSAAIVPYTTAAANMSSCTRKSLQAEWVWRQRGSAAADSMADWPTNSRVKEQTVTFTLRCWSESQLLITLLL